MKKLDRRIDTVMVTEIEREREGNLLDLCVVDEEARSGEKEEEEEEESDEDEEREECDDMKY